MKLILSLFTIVHIIAGKALSNEEACHRSSPNLNACLLKQSENVVKQLASGIPEYEMEPLEPFNLDFMTVEGDMENFRMKMAMTNLTFHGYGNAKFHKIEFDPETLAGEVSFTLPRLTMSCDYLATGKLFTVPLESNAHYCSNSSGISFSINFRLKTVQRKDVEYFTVDKLSGKVNGDNYHMKIESVDPARQPQVNLIQDFCNENVDLVIKTVGPVVNEYNGPFYKYMFESYLRKIPAAELLPF